MIAAWNIAPLIVAGVLLPSEVLPPLYERLLVTVACVLLIAGLIRTRRLCPLCGYPAARNDTLCLRCGSQLPGPARWWVWMVLAPALIGVCSCWILDWCLLCDGTTPDCLLCSMDTTSASGALG